MPHESGTAVEPFTPPQIEGYLARMGYDGPRDVALGTLTALHRAHLLGIPFENLDIHTGRHIALAFDRFYGKIVGERRGGFCYELNGAFAALLTGLGFDVTMLSANVAMPDGSFTPDFDHMTLRVVVDGSEMLADVGFGDSFVDPLRLITDVEQAQDGRTFRLGEQGDMVLLEERDAEGWKPMFRFDLVPHRLDEYVSRCNYLQTSPDSVFAQRRVCSIATPSGRITISNDRLIVTEGDQRTETTLDGEAAFRRTLEDTFGIRL